MYSTDKTRLCIALPCHRHAKLTYVKHYKCNAKSRIRQKLKCVTIERKYWRIIVNERIVRVVEIHYAALTQGKFTVFYRENKNSLQIHCKVCRPKVHHNNREKYLLSNQRSFCIRSFSSFQHKQRHGNPISLFIEHWQLCYTQ